MLTLFLVTSAIMLVLVLAMAIGVLVGRAPIKGSCGGMKALRMNTACEICGNDPIKCNQDTASKKSATDA